MNVPVYVVEVWSEERERWLLTDKGMFITYLRKAPAVTERRYLRSIGIKARVVGAVLS